VVCFKSNCNCVNKHHLRLSFSTLENGGGKRLKIVVDNNEPTWTSKTHLVNFVHDVTIHKSVMGDYEYLVYKHAIL
jgi:hypothetical protein